MRSPDIRTPGEGTPSHLQALADTRPAFGRLPDSARRILAVAVLALTAQACAPVVAEGPKLYEYTVGSINQVDPLTGITTEPGPVLGFEFTNPGMGEVNMTSAPAYPADDCDRQIAGPFSYDNQRLLACKFYRAYAGIPGLLEEAIDKLFEFERRTYVVAPDDIAKACGLNAAGCYRDEQGAIVLIRRFSSGQIAHEVTHGLFDSPKTRSSVLGNSCLVQEGTQYWLYRPDLVNPDGALGVEMRGFTEMLASIGEFVLVTQTNPGRTWDASGFPPHVPTYFGNYVAAHLDDPRAGMVMASVYGAMRTMQEQRWDVPFFNALAEGDFQTAFAIWHSATKGLDTIDSGGAEEGLLLLWQQAQIIFWKDLTIDDVLNRPYGPDDIEFAVSQPVNTFCDN